MNLELVENVIPKRRTEKTSSILMSPRRITYGLTGFRLMGKGWSLPSPFAECPPPTRRFPPAMRKLVPLLVLLIAFAAFADELAVCAVCGPREGSGPEPVKAHATHKGKDYAFCSLKCKVEFLKNPDEFLFTDEGSPAPGFALKTYDGRAVSLADFRGKVVLLDFWGTYCPPCVAALPKLQALHEEHAARGFAVVGVTIEDRAPMVKKATAKITYPIVQGTPQVWSAYKVNALPSLVLVGRDGRIVRRFGGEADHAAMVAEIEKALAQ